MANVASLDDLSADVVFGRLVTTFQAFDAEVCDANRILPELIRIVASYAALVPHKFDPIFRSAHLDLNLDHPDVTDEERQPSVIQLSDSMTTAVGTGSVYGHRRLGQSEQRLRFLISQANPRGAFPSSSCFFGLERFNSVRPETQTDWSERQLLYFSVIDGHPFSRLSRLDAEYNRGFAQKWSEAIQRLGASKPITIQIDIQNQTVDVSYGEIDLGHVFMRVLNLQEYYPVWKFENGSVRILNANSTESQSAEPPDSEGRTERDTSQPSVAAVKPNPAAVNNRVDAADRGLASGAGIVGRIFTALATFKRRIIG
jgi:hypothetical protein